MTAPALAVGGELASRKRVSRDSRHRDVSLFSMKKWWPSEKVIAERAVGS